MQLDARNQQQANSVDVLELWINLLTHWWKILLAGVLCGAMAFIYTYTQITPTYSATAKMFVTSSSSASALLTASDLTWGSNFKADYGALLQSRALMEQVAENLSYPRSADELAYMVSIGEQKDTRILSITVTSPYPVEAADIANEVARQSRIFLPEVMKLEAPSFYEAAVVPTNKNGPNYSNNTLMGAIAGVVLCAGCYVLLFIMNDSVTTPDDVMKYTGVQPLATIPEVENADKKVKRKKKKKKNDYEEKTDQDDSGIMLEQLLNQKIREDEQNWGGNSK